MCAPDSSYLFRGSVVVAGQVLGSSRGPPRACGGYRANAVTAVGYRATEVRGCSGTFFLRVAVTEPCCVMASLRCRFMHSKVGMVVLVSGHMGHAGPAGVLPSTVLQHISAPLVRSVSHYPRPCLGSLRRRPARINGHLKGMRRASCGTLFCLGSISSWPSPTFGTNEYLHASASGNESRSSGCSSRNEPLKRFL